MLPHIRGAVPDAEGVVGGTKWFLGLDVIAPFSGGG